MSRFKTTDTPELQPGVDYVTGSATGPFIDTGKDILFGERVLGRIYLSKATVAELAREFGIIKDQATDEALQDAYFRGKLDGMKENVGGDLNAVVATLRSWLAYVDSDVAADS